MECNIEIEGYTKKSNKNNKKSWEYSYQEILKQIGLTTLLATRMRSDLIETFKIINGVSKCDRHFSKFLLNGIKKFKIEFDDFEDNGKKKNLRGHFWELMDEWLNRIFLLYSCNYSVYVPCKDSFFSFCFFSLFLRVDKRRY